jgi:LEA14-like dessication related protein
MLKTARTAIALLIGIACVSAMRPTLAASPEGNKKPNVKLKGVTLNRVDWSKHAAEATILVEIDNPGSEFKVKDVSYRLKLNGQVAAEGKHKNEVKVPAASSVAISLPITVNLSLLPAVTWSTVADGLKMSYELEAEFTVPVFAFFNHKVKTVFTGELTPGSLMSSMSNLVKGQPGIKP